MRRDPGSRGIALAILLGTAVPASGQDWRDFRAARQTGPIESLDVELLYGAGMVSVSRSEAPFLYDARVRYDTERFQPIRGWTTDGTRGRLRLALTSAGDESDGASVQLDDWDIDFDFDDLRNSGDELGTLDFELHPDIPTDLRLGIGAATATLELGDLSLTSLEVMTGASRTEIDFDKPNRVRMSNLTLKAGAADFDAEGLGNARFDEMEFKGAIGDVRLDFSGEWERSASAEITMGVGELEIRVPRRVGVRIVRSSLLMKLDADEFEKVDGAYVTPNWDTAEIKLEIALAAAFGTIVVERF